MNAEMEIKKQILIDILDSYPDLFEMPKDNDLVDFMGGIDEGDLSDYFYDEMSSFRSSGDDTNLEPESYSRHYECAQVAKKLDNGKSVSWTYWYGGGKHSEPDAIDWMEYAYFVDCEQVQTIKNIYTKIEEK